MLVRIPSFLNSKTAQIVDGEVSEDSDAEATAPEGNAEAEKTIKNLESRIEAQGKVGEDQNQKIGELETELADGKQAMDTKAKETKEATDELVQNCNDATELLKASEARDETINPLLGQVFKLKTVLSVAEKEALPEDTQATLKELFDLYDKLDIGPKAN